MKIHLSRMLSVFLLVIALTLEVLAHPICSYPIAGYVATPAVYSAGKYIIAVDTSVLLSGGALSGDAETAVDLVWTVSPDGYLSPQGWDAKTCQWSTTGDKTVTLRVWDFDHEYCVLTGGVFECCERHYTDAPGYFRVIRLNAIHVWDSQGNCYMPAPSVLYVNRNDTVRFKAVPYPSTSVWPYDKPEWYWPSDVSGTPGPSETKDLTFSVLGNKTITCNCGNTESLTVCVQDNVQVDYVFAQYDGQAYGDYFGNTPAVVPVGTLVPIYAVPTPEGATWPIGKPTWSTTGGVLTPQNDGSGRYPVALLTNLSTPGDYTITAVCGNPDPGDNDVVVRVVNVSVQNVVFNPKILRADGSFTCTASATTTPPGRTLVWSIQGTNLGCSINSSTGVVTAGTTAGTIVARATDSQFSDRYAEAQLKVVMLQELLVSGANLFRSDDPMIYTTQQEAGANVTITATLSPSVAPADLPSDFIVWTNGVAGANQTQRLVSRAVGETDVTVTASCGPVTRRARIYVRPADTSNPAVAPTPQPHEFENAPSDQFQPLAFGFSFHPTSVGDYWYARVDWLNCPGNLYISAWPSEPNVMTTPNTAHPLHNSGNINNEVGSENRWSYAIEDLSNYNEAYPIGGAGPDWHNTAATRAHERYHFYTDWMVTCVQQVANWPGAEIDIESKRVSVFDYLTKAEADAALTADVTDRLATFGNAAFNHYNNVIILAEGPGRGRGSYAEGQAVLDKDKDAVEAFRIDEGWPE